MTHPLTCPTCRGAVAPKDLFCRHCKGRVRYRTVREAWLGGGMGMYDILPGIRDWSYTARFALCSVKSLYCLVIFYCFCFTPLNNWINRVFGPP